jgi:alpha-glucosidase
VLSNHDMVRHVTRYGGGELGERRARAAILLLLALPGAAYLYQGEELGLPEVTDLPDAVLQDPTFVRSGGQERGRDGCRVPLPWAGERPSYGFGPGPAAWLPQPPNWATLTRERQASDADSVLQLYRSALALRRDVPSLGVGPFAWADGPPGVIAFHRGPDLTCVVNVGDDAVALDATGRVVLASGPLGSNGSLPGVTGVWLTS